MKKTVCCFLIAVTCIAPGLWGSGQNESGKAVATTGKVEVIVPTGGFYIQALTDNLKPIVNERLPGLELVVSPEGQENTSGTEALAARIAAGDIPDVYIGPRGARAADLARAGTIIPIDGLPGLDAIVARIRPNLMDRSLGKLYFLPYEAITTVMLYNRDLFREAGLDPDKAPETWDELLAGAQKISALPARSWGAKTYGATTWTEALTWGSWYWNMLAPVWANFNDGKSKLFNQYGTDIVFDKPELRMVEFFTYMKKLQKYAPDSMENKIWMREVGIWPQFGVGWRANLAQGRDKPMVIGRDVAVAPVPVLTKGMKHWTMLGGRGVTIFKTNEQQEKKAWEVVKLMFDKEYYLLHCKTLSVLPATEDLAKDDFFKGPEIKVFVDALDNVVEEESFAAFDAVAGAVLKNLTKVMITGELSPEEGVKTAAAEARAALKASMK